MRKKVLVLSIVFLSIILLITTLFASLLIYNENQKSEISKIETEIRTYIPDKLKLSNQKDLEQIRISELNLEETDKKLFSDDESNTVFVKRIDNKMIFIYDPIDATSEEFEIKYFKMSKEWGESKSFKQNFSFMQDSKAISASNNNKRLILLWKSSEGFSSTPSAEMLLILN